MSEDTGSVDDMSDDERRHDQLTTARKASEEDAAPRIEVTEHDGVVAIVVVVGGVDDLVGRGARGGWQGQRDRGGQRDEGGENFSKHRDRKHVAIPDRG